MSSPSISTQYTSYKVTSLSEEGVAKKSGFLLWETQPALFKSYPRHLFSYGLDDHEAFEVIKKARMITSTVTVGDTPYHRLNTPSAGNLHPLELYVQMRGVKGVLSGIYHVDVKNEKLVLLQEIEADGLESYIGKTRRFQGMIFVLSSVYFRSFWKYGIRAWRYVYLDAGHQIAALQAALSLHDQKGSFVSGFDTKGLNHIMGFEHQEHVVAVLSVGQDMKRAAKPFERALMNVQPTDYMLKDMTMQAWLEEAKVFECERENIYESYERDLLESALLKRRSSRAFDAAALSKKSLKRLLHLFSHKPDTLEVSFGLFNVENQKVGLYHFSEIGESVSDVDLKERITSALVRQNVVATAGVVIFITSNRFDETVLMQAGELGHQIYLESTIGGVGCSGIGAFYDEALASLLQKKYILYALVVGNE